MTPEREKEIEVMFLRLAASSVVEAANHEVAILCLEELAKRLEMKSIDGLTIRQWIAVKRLKVVKEKLRFLADFSHSGTAELEAIIDEMLAEGEKYRRSMEGD